MGKTAVRVIIAIDPGQSGAIAVRDPLGRVYTETMPETLRDIWDFFFNMGSAEPTHVYLEEAGYHVKGNNASASCKFARHCGSLEMAIIARGFPWQAVRPQVWMKHFGTLPKDKKARKNRIKELMQRMYPSIRVTLANADALALLTYAINKGESQ